MLRAINNGIAGFGNSPTPRYKFVPVEDRIRLLNQFISAQYPGFVGAGQSVAIRELGRKASSIQLGCSVLGVIDASIVKQSLKLLLGLQLDGLVERLHVTRKRKTGAKIGKAAFQQTATGPIQTVLNNL